MKFSLALTITILSCFGLAYLIEPDTTAAPDTITDCTYWQVASENDTCASISAYWGPTIGFTEAQFVVYNPSLGAASCENDLIVGNSYCIEQNFGIPAPSSTMTLMTSTTSTPTPTPTTIFGICEAQASGYKDYCPRCLSLCANETKYVADCFYSTFGRIQYYESQCWQHGGIDCTNKAVDIVCPK